MFRLSTRFVMNYPPSAIMKSTHAAVYFNPLNAKLNPTCNLLALLGAHHILHVSKIRVNTPPTTSLGLP
jgi:hypothetical protein